MLIATAGHPSVLDGQHPLQRITNSVLEMAELTLISLNIRVSTVETTESVVWVVAAVCGFLDLWRAQLQYQGK
jgi:hypothetical protein